MDIHTETQSTDLAFPEPELEPEPDLAQRLPRAAAEGRLAAQFASADAWARECQLLAGQRRTETERMRKWLAQGVSLMRESKSALRELRQLQTARR